MTDPHTTKRFLTTAAVLIVCAIGYGMTHGSDGNTFSGIEAGEGYTSHNYISWSGFKHWAIRQLVGEDMVIMNVKYGAATHCGTEGKLTIESDLSGAYIENIDNYSPGFCLGVEENRKSQKAKLAPGEQKI